MKILTIMLAVMIIMSSLFAGNVMAQKMDMRTTGGLTIAYVYGNDDNTKNLNWSNYILSYGYYNLSCCADNVVGFDFSTANLIIIGANTTYSWNTSTTNAIKNTGKPVLGIGYGGLELFAKEGLTLDWQKAMGTNTNQLYVANMTSSLFKTPNSISIPANRNLTIYPSSSIQTQEYPLNAFTSNDTVFGKNPGNMYDGLLCAEMNPGKPISMMWGWYTISPSELNSVGKKLLQNAIVFCANNAVVPELPLISIASLGLMALFVVVFTVGHRRKER